MKLTRIILLLLVSLLLITSSVSAIDQDIVDEQQLEDEYNQDFTEEDGVELPIVEYYKGEVIKKKEIVDEELETEQNIARIQVLDVEIIEGPFKKRVYTIENHLSDNPILDIDVDVGDKVIVYTELTKDGSDIIQIFVSDYYRINHLRNLLILFMILLLIIGGLKGIKAIISLTLTALGIFYFMLPNLLKGYSPVPLAIVLCIVITTITILILNGMKLKSFTTIVGTLIGVLFAGILSYVVGSLTMLSGLGNEEAMMLMYIPQGIEFDYKGLLFAGILIGSLGAVMDVAMSISSSMEELKDNNPYISPKKLIKSGFTVGRDIMGTMSNTLILAYAGSTIPLLLIFSAYKSSMLHVLNLDVIATEIVRALVGSIGLLISIPVTIFIYAYIYKRNQYNNEQL